MESNTNLINGKLSYNLINFHLWELLLIICHGSWRKHNRRNGQINRTTILVKWNIQLPSSSSDVHLPQNKKEEWFYISILSSQKWYTIFQLIIHIKWRLTIPFLRVLLPSWKQAAMSCSIREHTTFCGRKGWKCNPKECVFFQLPLA